MLEDVLTPWNGCCEREGDDHASTSRIAKDEVIGFSDGIGEGRRGRDTSSYVVSEDNLCC